MSDETAEQRYVPECYACPIGTASMAVQGAVPDATEHLIRAGRELVGAFKSFVEGLDSLLKTMEERSAAAKAPSQRIQAIPIRRETPKA